MKKKIKMYKGVSIVEAKTIFTIGYFSMSSCEFVLSIKFPNDTEVIAKLGHIHDIETLRNMCDEILREVKK